MKKTFVLFAVVASIIFTIGNSTAFADSYPAVDVPAGPIRDNDDAKAKCPSVCSSLQWNNQWKTTEPNVMSVCGTTAGVDVPVGQIRDNEDAQQKCPSQLKKVAWNGQWKTTQPEVMSVCGCAVQSRQVMSPQAISPGIAAAWMYMSDAQQYGTIPQTWSNINFKDVDVLNVGPAGVQADGTFGLYNSAKTGDLANRFKWIIQTARSQNPNIKIIVSQWWGNGDGIWGKSLSVVNTDAAVSKYTDSVAAFLQSYLSVSDGVDGYDIDYESNNIVSNISTITSQIRTKMDTLSKANGGRSFYLTVSPAQTRYLSAAVASLNFVNMQTYAGGSGLTPQDFTGMGLKSQQLLYGICPETNCSTPTVSQAEAQYTNNKLAGIHLWRLNSDNYIYEGKVQAQIYKFLHPLR